MTQVSRKKKLIGILWPSFVCAGLFAGLFFAFVDPIVLMEQLGIENGSRLGGYSVIFLFFWALGALSISAAIVVLCTPDVKPPSHSVPDTELIE